VKFFIPGRPATAGSKKGFPVRTKTGIRVAIVDSSGQRGKDWRSDCKRFASDFAPDELYQGPLGVTLRFQLHRPKSHYGSGKNERKRKPSAPIKHIQTPDVLKLARAVEDALTGIIWKDDKQICAEFIEKEWVDPWDTQGVLVEIATL